MPGQFRTSAVANIDFRFGNVKSNSAENHQALMCAHTIYNLKLQKTDTLKKIKFCKAPYRPNYLFLRHMAWRQSCDNVECNAPCRELSYVLHRAGSRQLEAGRENLEMVVWRSPTGEDIG